MRYSKFNANEVKKLYNIEKSIIKVGNILNITPTHVARLIKTVDPNYTPFGPKHYELNHGFFNTVNHESSYVIGYITGDGNISKSENKVSILTDKNDYNVLGKIKNSMGFTGNIRTEKTGHKTLTWHSKEHKDVLINKYGVHPNKGKVGYVLPKENEILFPDWLRGLFDSDGHILLFAGDKACVTISFANKYKEFLSKIFDFLKTKLKLYNLHSYDYTEGFINNYSGSCYSLKFVDFDALQVLSYMFMDVPTYNKIYLERKYNEWLKLKPFCELDVNGIYRWKGKRHDCEIVEKLLGKIKSKFRTVFTLEDGRKVSLHEFYQAFNTENDAEYHLLLRRNVDTKRVINIFYIPKTECEIKEHFWINSELAKKSLCKFDIEQFNKWLIDFRESEIGNFQLPVGQ